MKRKITCSMCNINPHEPSSRLCNPCHAKYMREWRKNHKQNEEQKKKSICRSYSKVYLKRGKIFKSNCIICNSIDSQMHHEDYTKPLEVIWMCRKCHLNYHKKQIDKLTNLHY